MHDVQNIAAKMLAFAPTAVSTTLLARTKPRRVHTNTDLEDALRQTMQKRVLGASMGSNTTRTSLNLPFWPTRRRQSVFLRVCLAWKTGQGERSHLHRLSVEPWEHPAPHHPPIVSSVARLIAAAQLHWKIPLLQMKPKLLRLHAVCLATSPVRQLQLRLQRSAMSTAVWKLPEQQPNGLQLLRAAGTCSLQAAV
jgi:hypothetical protein